MRCNNQVAVIAGLAPVTPCAAQPAADDVRASQREVAASVAGDANFFSQTQPAFKVSGQFQFRYVVNARDQVPGGGKNTAAGFQTRRMKLDVSGAIDDRWSYKVNWFFSKGSSQSTLDDTYVDCRLGSRLIVRSGQFTHPYLREEVVSSTRQLAAERSITNEFFTQNNSQGVQLGHSLAKVRWTAALGDGLDTANTDFTSSSEADYALTDRVEYMFAGDDWNRFEDFTSWSGGDFVGMVGGALNYQCGGQTFNTSDENLTGLTADLSIEGDGWNSFLAATYQHVDPASGSSLENWGLVAQGGHMVDPSWEIFGRYDVIFSDQSDDFSTITAGVNHYLIPKSHAAKFTGDVQYFLDTQSTSDAPTSTGTALLSSDEDNQWVIRLQLQILF